MGALVREVGYKEGRSLTTGKRSGKRDVPPPQKIFRFWCENDVFWCIFGTILSN